MSKFEFIAQENAATLRHFSLHFSHFFFRRKNSSPISTCGKNTLHPTAAIWASHGVSPKKISFKRKKGDWTKLDPSMLDFQGLVNICCFFFNKSSPPKLTSSCPYFFVCVSFCDSPNLPHEAPPRCRDVTKQEQELKQEEDMALGCAFWDKKTFRKSPYISSVEISSSLL